MKVLFVTPYVPSLMRVRPFNFIKQLSRRHSVTLVCLSQGDSGEESSLEELHDLCDGVLAFPTNKLRSVASCCRRLFSRMPLQAAYTCTSELTDLISALARTREYDVLHVEHIRGAHLSEGVRHIPRIFDSVDCITRLLKLRLAHHRGVLQQALHLEELFKMRRYEPRVAAAFDRVVVTSRHDKKALEALIRRFCPRVSSESLERLLRSGELSELDRLSCDQLAVVRNGVDCDYFSPMPVATEPGTIVFSGRMSYFPNVSAVLSFYDEVFPLVRARRPDARLRIVGSDPPESVRRLARDLSVEVTGYVPDLRPHIASASVVVCPLKVGVGIQNKVLEAMAMGKPVVASSVACKGIPDVEDGRHLVRTDEPERMAEAVLGLMDGAEFAARLGDRARRFVERAYSWEAAARSLEDVYEQAMESARYRLPAAA